MKESLKQLIEDKKFDYVNSDITDELFPVPTIKENVEYELVHFNKDISSEDAITELSKGGWRPATIYDLLNWTEWNDKDWVVALGSVAEVVGFRHVSCLGKDGSERNLDLGWFDDVVWGSGCRFLRVRNLDSKKVSTSDTQALGTLDTLEKAVDFIKLLE